MNPAATISNKPFPTAVLYPVFVFSGLSALIYQTIWQRVLLTQFGSNIESVALVVSAFLLGLGLGSLIGGKLSATTTKPLPLIFALIEMGIGIYGLISLRLFAWVAKISPAMDTWGSGLLSFFLILVPTLLMGATLPLLVAHRVRETGQVGDSISKLYFVNTLGAAFGAFLAAFFLLGRLGQSGSILVAATLNLVAAISVGITWWTNRKTSAAGTPLAATEASASRTDLQTLRKAMILAAISGFLALNWEILWARLYNITTASRAIAFGAMLGSYLLGLALGSLISMRRWRSGHHRPQARLGAWIIGANLASFLVAPIVAYLVGWMPNGLICFGAYEPEGWFFTLPLVAAAAAAQGLILPALCESAIPPDKNSGQNLSFIYLANIIGSGLGSLFTGFFLLNHLNFFEVQALTLFIALTCGLWAMGKQVKSWSVSLRAATLAVTTLLIAAALTPNSLRDSFWPRLFYKTTYSGESFVYTKESKHGVINIDDQMKVYGSGVFDGVIDTRLRRGDWHVRPYFISAIHPNPKRILVIGVSAGIWSQILVHHPQVDHVDAVEISASYRELISEFPQVSSLLTNPKFHLHIDDGRRWLRRNPEKKYDAIVMNTTLHWREFSANLLSVECLSLIRDHLNPGGIVMWNCTQSGRAAKTGMQVFPHTMMCLNNCVASDSPLLLDKARWRDILLRYKINNTPLFNPSVPEDLARLDIILNLLDNEAPPSSTAKDGTPYWWICNRARMQSLWGEAEVISDDNLGHEYELKPHG